MDNEYPRQTVFGASVNEREFLQDATGNSRFWTLPVTHLDYNHDVDMQQLFAQLKVCLDRGEQWWLTDAEEAQLTELNRHHRALGAIGEKVRAVLDLTRKDQSDGKRMSAAQVLGAIGIERPTNAQFKECNAVLRECLGESKRINGVNKWCVPLIIPDEYGVKPMSRSFEPDDVF
jgi:predicted P-loop ATPase